MQAIDQALLSNVHGGLGPIDVTVANSCAAATGAAYAPAGAIAGGVAGGIATGGAGIVPGAEAGAKVGGLLGLAVGWFGSVLGQAFGGNPCPTATLSTPTVPPSASPSSAVR